MSNAYSNNAPMINQPRCANAVCCSVKEPTHLLPYRAVKIGNGHAGGLSHQLFYKRIYLPDPFVIEGIINEFAITNGLYKARPAQDG